MITRVASTLRRLRDRIGFRAQAAAIMGIVFGIFATITGTLAPQRISTFVTSAEVADGNGIATAFAGQSVLSLQTQAPENGSDAIQAAMSFPGIEHAAIYDRSNRLLLQDGCCAKFWKAQLRNAQVPPTTPAMYESDRHWHFLVPVFSDIEDSEFYVSDVANEYLGYVHIVRSKAALEQLLSKMGSYVVAVTGISLALALLTLVWLTTLLLRPVHNLSKTLSMSIASTSGTAVRVDEVGPAEIARMAKAFNRLMAMLDERDYKLREHSQALETEVQLRTSELVQARDLAVSASRHKSEFLAMISHELRTPLQSITGYTEMAVDQLSRAEGGTDAVPDLQIVLQAAEHLMRLIDNVLDFSRIEAGHLRIEPMRIDLTSLAKEVVDSMTPLARRNQNEISVRDSARPCVIRTDPGKLRQILLNLLSNACKFTHDGVINLAMENLGDSVTLSVVDTGPGIAASEQKMIFEAFRQARISQSHPHGAGLGLAITRRLCQALGGTIEVKSTLGQGATFIVRLPLDLGSNLNGETSAFTEAGDR